MPEQHPHQRQTGNKRPGAALITGGGRRIGRAICEKLARSGHDIGVHFHNSREEAAELAKILAGYGVRAEIFGADLADPAACQRLIGESSDAFGALPLLVNNAAIFEPDTLASLDLKGFERHMAVNLRAPVLLAQAFAKALPQDTDGAIINIIDQRVLRLNPTCFSYTLSKSALWTATRTLAQALAPRIRVNAIGPGPSLANVLEGDAGLNREAALVPLQHIVSPQQIAEAVLYLAGAHSVTGQMIAVDSGQHLSWRTPDVVANLP